MSNKLIPPDRERCQAVEIVYRPFKIGGDPNQEVRCSNKPSVVAHETVKGPDGFIGAMSLCSDCQDILREHDPELYQTLTMEQICDDDS